MAIKICPECGGKVAATRGDCPHCGYVFPQTKKCPECEEDIPADSKECPVCGFVFGDKAKAVTEKATPQTDIETPKEEAPTVEMEMEEIPQVKMPEVEMEMEEIPQAEASKNSDTVSTSSFGEIMSVIKKHDENEFLREVYLKLASETSTPADIVNASQFIPVKSLKTPYMIAKMDVSIQYSCSVGYDRQEQYWEEVWRRDSQGNSYKERVLKTRTVTDWHPHSGTNSGIYWEAGPMYYDEDVTVPGGDTVLTLCSSDDDVEEFTQEDAQEFSNLTPDPSTLSYLKRSAEISCYINASKPGDHVKDDHHTGTADVLKLCAAIVPHYNVEYTYNDKTYRASGLASSDMKVFVYTPPYSSQQYDIRKKQTRPLLLILGVPALVFLLGIAVVAIIMGVEGLAFAPIIGPLMIPFVVLFVKIRSDVLYTLSQIDDFTKQTEKLNSIDSLFAEKGWVPLTEEEREKICPQSLRESAIGNKRGWEKFIYGIAVKLTAGKSNSVSNVAEDSANTATDGVNTQKSAKAASGKHGAPDTVAVSNINAGNERTIRSIISLCLPLILAIMIFIPIHRYSFGGNHSIWYLAWDNTTFMPLFIVFVSLLGAALVPAVLSLVIKSQAKLLIALSVALTLASGFGMNIGIITSVEYVNLISPIIAIVVYSVLCLSIFIWNLVIKNETALKNKKIKIAAISLAGVITASLSLGLGLGLGLPGLRYVVHGVNTIDITGYKGNPKNLVIPEEIDGKKVDFIESRAFWECTSLESIEIPDSVTGIGFGAFTGCSSLKSITIPASITNIGQAAFQNCSSLKSVYYTGDIADWCGITFGDYFGLGLYSYDLYIDGSLVIELVIPNTVTEIKSTTFMGCSSLTSVIIPDSVTSIGNLAFNSCNNLKEVYYCGTAKDWYNISIDSYSSGLVNITRYYYSENEPTMDGNYWHYDTDGKTPIKWDN